MKILAWTLSFPLTIKCSFLMVELKSYVSQMDALDYTILSGTISFLTGTFAYFWFKYGVVQWLKEVINERY